MKFASAGAGLWGQVALIVLVALACSPKLGNAFVWDDIALIVESDRLHDTAQLQSAFWHDTMYMADGGKFQAQAQLDTYRPITLATFFVDAALSGRSPLGYHLDNLLAHLACVLLVYRWSLCLLGRDAQLRALFAAALFGLHPLLGEAHIWINGRSDVYATLFGLGGALLLMAQPRSTHPRRLGAAFVLLLLGLLSKETLAPFLILLLAWDLGVFERELASLRLTRALLIRATPALAALLVYTLLRTQALAGVHASAGRAQLWLALTRLPLLLLHGLAATLVPRNLMPPYLDELYRDVPTAALAAAALVLVALVGLVLAQRRRLPSLALGLCGFVLVLAPASLIATMAWYGLGRYLYLPIALLAPGLVALLSAGIERVAAFSVLGARLCGWGAGAYLLLFAARLAAGCPSWNGPEAFYQAIIAEYPAASHGHGGLGKWYVDQGNLAGAMRELKLAAEIAPQDSRYLNNLGVVYLRAGNVEAARQVAELGLQRFPTQQAKFEKLRTLALQATR
jgi:protein O-mannosyl-transferase